MDDVFDVQAAQTLVLCGKTQNDLTQFTT